MKLQASGEDYLEAILVLHKRIDMVNHTKHASPPTNRQRKNVAGTEAFLRVKWIP